MPWTKISTFDLAPSVGTATATTALGTSLTAISGLSLAVPVGTYDVEAVIFTVIVLAPTNTTFSLVSAGGLAASWVTGILYRNGSAVTLTPLTALNTSLGAAQASVIAARLEATIRITTAGTLSISGTRTGGTSQTVQLGSYLKLTKIG
jgi:hypothetical protein